MCFLVYIKIQSTHVIIFIHFIFMCHETKFHIQRDILDSIKFIILNDEVNILLHTYHAVLCSAMDTELISRLARLSLNISSMLLAGDNTTKSRSPYQRHRQWQRPGKSFSDDIISCHTIGITSGKKISHSKLCTIWSWRDRVNYFELCIFRMIQFSLFLMILRYINTGTMQYIGYLLVTTRTCFISWQYMKNHWDHCDCLKLMYMLVALFQWIKY
jgi:hypothetical protein